MFRKHVLENSENHEPVESEAIVYLASQARAILRALVDNVDEA